MSAIQHSKNCELVIGLVAPIGVNLDDVRNRLESLFAQFRYTMNWLHLSKLCDPYVNVQAEPLSELERLDRGMNNGRDLREKYRRGDFFALLAINAINEGRTDREANSNFERARALTNTWPQWKRSFELTKDSARGSAVAPATVAGNADEKRDSDGRADRSRSTK